MEKFIIFKSVKTVIIFGIIFFSLTGCNDSPTNDEESKPSKPVELTMAEKCANVGINEHLSNYPSQLGLELHSYKITDEEPVGSGDKPHGVTVYFVMDFTFNGQRMQTPYAKFCTINYGY